MRIEAGERFDRRTFLRLGAKAAVGAAGLVLVGCGVKEKERGSSSPEQGLSPREKWDQLPAVERLNRLEERGLDRADYSEIADFEPRQELALAVAQFYCQETRCLTSPEEMAAKVSFISDPDEFIAVFEKETGLVLTQQQRLDEARNRLEITVNDTKEVFVNLFGVGKQIEAIRPSDIEKVGEADYETKYLESILFHAMAHVDAADRRLSIDPFSFSVNTRDVDLRVTSVYEMIGFTFRGETSEGKEVFVSGTNEAATEFIAQYIGSKRLPYVILPTRYNDGANLIAAINELAGVSAEEFIRYNNELPVEGLLEKWGALKDSANPDIKAAILALAAIGFYVEGFADGVDETRRAVEYWLSIQLSH